MPSVSMGKAKWLWVTESLKLEIKQHSSLYGCIGDTSLVYSLEAFEKEKIFVIYCYFGLAVLDHLSAQYWLMYHLHLLSFLQHPFKINLLTDSSSIKNRLAMILNLESALAKDSTCIVKFLCLCHLLLQYVSYCLSGKAAVLSICLYFDICCHYWRKEIGTMWEFPQLQHPSLLYHLFKS